MGVVGAGRSVCVRRVRIEPTARAQTMKDSHARQQNCASGGALRQRDDGTIAGRQSRYGIYDDRLWDMVSLGPRRAEGALQ